jgi:hypothetical protein
MATSQLTSRIPSVVVAPLEPVHAMSLVGSSGRHGFTTMDADDLARFTPVVEVPPARYEARYTLVDVDTGHDLLNVTPDEAYEVLAAANRSPLTIEEGIALILQHPDVLRTHNAFSLLGSRCGDRRVPALWLSKGRPRLGWCWAGNPHTWLGSASCATRIGA